MKENIKHRSKNLNRIRRYWLISRKRVTGLKRNNKEKQLRNLKKMILISFQPERKALQRNPRIRLKNFLSFLRIVRLNHLFQNNLPQIQLKKVKQSMDSKLQQE